MELKQLEYFLELAHCEHVSQAADNLNIAQPTLSRSIASLEKDLGVRLFDRVGNHIRLNHSGTEFLKYTQSALGLLQSARISAQSSKFDTIGTISIATMAFSPILMPVIQDYIALNPRVDIKLIQHDGERREDLPVNSYDFILAASGDDSIDDDNDQYWTSQKLFTEKNYLVIAPAHPLFSECVKEGDAIDLSLLKNENFITMNFGRSFTDRTYEFCQKAGFVPRTPFQTDHFVAKMSAIRSGMAVSFLPESCLESAAYLCPGMKAFELKGDSTCRNVLLMRKKRSLLTETANDFWDFLLDFYHLPEDLRD